MFKNANLELHFVSTAILDWCITGRRFDGSAVWIEKALGFLAQKVSFLHKSIILLHKTSIYSQEPQVLILCSLYAFFYS